jgi:hypothetical protein
MPLVHLPACPPVPHNRIVGLPSSTTADSLLSATGKKSGLKQGAAWKMGAQRTIECKHADGASMKLSVQVGLGGWVWEGGRWFGGGGVHKARVALHGFKVLVHMWQLSLYLVTRVEMQFLTPGC